MDEIGETIASSGGGAWGWLGYRTPDGSPTVSGADGIVAPRGSGRSPPFKAGLCGRRLNRASRMADVIFSLERSKSEIVMRLLSAEAKLSDMRSGQMNDDDWTRLARRMSEVSEAPLFVGISLT